MIWFTADTHFGHAAILKHCKGRKHLYRDLDTMDSGIIDNINAVVSRHDTLYHLGDFCWHNAGHYRQRINCKDIRIIQGNHDSSSLRSHVSSMNLMGFLKNPKIHLSHYPLVSWGAMHYGGIHLYGHCHGTMESKLDKFIPGRRAMDVGIDNIFNILGTYRPISLEEVSTLVC